MKVGCAGTAGDDAGALEAVLVLELPQAASCRHTTTAQTRAHNLLQVSSMLTSLHDPGARWSKQLLARGSRDLG